MPAFLHEHRGRLPFAGENRLDSFSLLQSGQTDEPSRFGSVRRLFDFYDACEREGIALYGGGQYELGPGRDLIQLLASIFHPDAPNDVAPGGYNAPAPVAGLPVSPLPRR